MEGLDLDNILSEDEVVSLFEDSPTEKHQEQQEENSAQAETNEQEADNENNDTAEIDVEHLFDEDNQSESVGSDGNNNEGKKDSSSNEEGTSSNNFYSSIANALREEDVFPDLNDDNFNDVKSAEDFRDLIEQQIQAQLTNKQRRIDEALTVGVSPSEITKYENTINYLNSISEDLLTSEGAQGEDIRRRLIVQDLMNRGYTSQSKIDREVKKSFDSGSDIEDAREALEGNKNFFQSQYQAIINEAKAADAQEKKDREEQANKLRTSILEDKNLFGDLEVDKTTRKRVYDNIAKPTYRDPETGGYYTAIQKYEMDNRVDFLKNVSLIYTLTDGFKNLGNIVKGKVRKEVKKGLQELENTINNTARTSSGNLNYARGRQDKNSYFSNLSLDF